jgi:hypothetical protein
MLSSQLDVFQAKQKQLEDDKELVFFYLKCRTKHSSREFPVNVDEVCRICDQYHPIKSCPYLPRIKVVYRGTSEETKPTYFLTSKKPWKA